MKKIKHIFIMNPMAGRGGGTALLKEKIRDACTAAAAEFELYETTARHDATRYIRRRISEKPSGEVWRFYACGGDGTLSEVIDGAVNPSGELFPGIEIGCVPVGTGNDFVRNFSHTAFFLDITKQLLADSAEIDCYRMDGILADGSTFARCGVNMINIGFDCDAARQASEMKKKKFLPNCLAYIAGVLITLKKNQGRVITVRRGDGSVVIQEFELVAAANGGWCGGGFHSAPKSALCDGLLDISLIKKVTRTQLLRLIGFYKNGTHLETRLGKKMVAYFREPTVGFEFDEPADVCIDGEILTMKSLTLTILPRSARFAVPVGSEMI